MAARHGGFHAEFLAIPDSFALDAEKGNGNHRQSKSYV